MCATTSTPDDRRTPPATLSQRLVLHRTQWCWLLVGWVGSCALVGTVDGNNCAELNFCSGHGMCAGPHISQCLCFKGWGAESDIATVKAPDCSYRTCPSGRAWGDVASKTNEAHALAECSSRGTCDTSTGLCRCFPGFEGDACQRLSCPNDCSGHGRCLSMAQMAVLDEALPLNNRTFSYEGEETTYTWDEDMLYGCVCDSSWSVGLGSGETQEPEWFGYDCSKRRCPTGDDPRTEYTDETDCFNKTSAGGFGSGAYGNKCHVDCSNRGICNHGSGLCECFTGYYGNNCGSMSALAT